MGPLTSLLRLYDAGHARALLISSALANLLLLAPSFHMLQVYDRVLNSGSTATLIYISLIALGALGAYGVVEAQRGRIAQRLAAAYTVAVARKLFARFVNPPAGSASPVQYLRDYGQVRAFLGGRGLVALFDLPFLPLYLVLMFMVHWSIGLATVLGIVVMLAISVANSALTDPHRSAGQKADEDAFGFAQTAFARAEDVRAFGLLQNFMEIWGKRTALSLIAGEQSARENAKFYALARSFRQMLQIIIMAWAAWLVLAGNMSGGLIFFASMIAGKALAPIEQLTGSWDQLAKARAAYLRLEQHLGSDRDLAIRPDLPRPKGLIELDRVYYRPPGAELPIIGGISLSVSPGELIIITGDAASGKSALLRLLAGALAPDHGAVRLDGADHGLWPAAQWGNALGYLSQDISLFPGSIAENIARFDPDIDMNAVYDAARRIGAHDMIVKMPNGYLTMIGDERTHLSGSQRQKIGLARAFYRNPCVLVLDQPGLHLDGMGEGMLMNALVEAKARGTAMIVASQRSAIMMVADRAFALRNSRLEPIEIERAATRQMRQSQPQPEPLQEMSPAAQQQKPLTG